jgi:hypothetical protein
MLFSSVDDDMKRLNRTLGSLEKLSQDISEFIRLLHPEALPKVDQTPRSIAPSMKVHGPKEKRGETRKKKRVKRSATQSNPTSGPFFFSKPPPVEEKMEELPPAALRCIILKDQQLRLLQVRLEAALAEICKAVELADSYDLEDLEWLAYWAGILREAKEQGHDFPGTTRARKTVKTEGNKDLVVECDQEEDELGTFVHRLEGLVRDVEYFIKLVYMCPAR